MILVLAAQVLSIRNAVARTHDFIFNYRRILRDMHGDKMCGRLAGCHTFFIIKELPVVFIIRTGFGSRKSGRDIRIFLRKHVRYKGGCFRGQMSESEAAAFTC